MSIGIEADGHLVATWGQLGQVQPGALNLRDSFAIDGEVAVAHVGLVGLVGLVDLLWSKTKARGLNF